MDGMTLLQEARAAGLIVSVEGGTLKIRGPRQAEVVAKKLIAHKPAVVNALRVETLPEPPPDLSPWDLDQEWYECWEERVCIMRYDGKMPVERAEALALADILRQMRIAGFSLPDT